MKSKQLFLVGLICLPFIFGACVQKETKQETTTTIEDQSMQAVDSSKIEKETEKKVLTESTIPKEKTKEIK